MIDVKAGDWVLLKGWQSDLLAPDLEQVEAVTPQLVKYKYSSFSTRLSQSRKGNVIAALPTKESAEALMQNLSGLRGERTRRIAAANESAEEAAHAAIAAALAAHKGDTQ